MNAALRDALVRVEVAQLDLCEALQREYPAGADIQWKRRADAYCEGKVIRHGFGGRILVKNRLTGGTYWINPSNIGWTE